MGNISRLRLLPKQDPEAANISSRVNADELAVLCDHESCDHESCGHEKKGGDGRSLKGRAEKSGLKKKG